MATAFKVHKSNHTDAAWGIIKDEVMLAIRAAHIYEVKSKIEEIVIMGTRIYNLRHGGCDEEEDQVAAGSATPRRR